MQDQRRHLHWNSVELLSFRHLDVVYRIDRATGAIDWKLGGVSRPESLTAVRDPLSAVSTFCGQPDARVLADGRPNADLWPQQRRAGALECLQDATIQNETPLKPRPRIGQ